MRIQWDQNMIAQYESLKAVDVFWHMAKLQYLIMGFKFTLQQKQVLWRSMPKCNRVT